MSMPGPAVTFILASASPRRADLLRAAGFAFDTLVVDVDETPRSGEPAVDYVQRLARDKANAAQTALGSQGLPVILAADTAVVVDGDILGKPGSVGEARDMLKRLSGRSHDVMTGVAIARGDVVLVASDVTAVTVAALSDAELDWYAGSGEGMDKAGAYAIQGLASRFIPRIEGSYSNVVGLPLATVYHLLSELGGEAARLASGR